MKLHSFIIGLFLILAPKLSLCLRYNVNEVLSIHSTVIYTERYMFASHEGPSLLEQGSSSINLDIFANFYTLQNISTTIAYGIYGAKMLDHSRVLENLCDNVDVLANQWSINMQAGKEKGHYVGLTRKYDVVAETWYNVAIQVCPKRFNNDIVTPHSQIDGTITFKNPYGYLPTELYGMLPSEGARAVVLLAFAVFFMLCYCKFWHSLLPLHHAILGVFLVALTEATVWYVAYQTINLTGEPYCCPFPNTVIAATVLQVFRQASGRCLLLVVALGYGVARPKLLSSEWTCIALVSLLYLASALASQVHDIISLGDIHADNSSSSKLYKIPETVVDSVFLAWIFLSLNSTIRVLREFQQTVKLRLYQRLVTVMVIFACLFVCATVFSLLGGLAPSWPWQYAWLSQVSWELLNLAVLVTVCLVSLPSDSSRMMAYSSQLPSEDPGNDNDEDGDAADAGVDHMQLDYDYDSDPGFVESDEEVDVRRSSSGGGRQGQLQMTSMTSKSKPFVLSAARSAGKKNKSDYDNLPTASDEC